MKRRGWILAGGIFIIALIVTWFTLARAPQPIIEGRLLLEWLQEMDGESVLGESVKAAKANQVLYSAGPAILPALSEILRQNNSPWVMRLPAPLIPERLKARYDRQVRLQVNAAWIISVIAYRNPNHVEVCQVIPSLIESLSSRSPQVRYISAQGLAAIGAGASNAVPTLLLRTADESPSVRMCAVEALGRINIHSTESLRVVRAVLGDTNKDLRFAATQALARLERKTDDVSKP